MFISPISNTSYIKASSSIRDISFVRNVCKICSLYTCTD